MKTRQEKRFIVCIHNDDCEDLELRKIYEVLQDKASEQGGYIRVVDESGEDYLYPSEYFLPSELSRDLVKALMAA